MMKYRNNWLFSLFFHSYLSFLPKYYQMCIHFYFMCTYFCFARQVNSSIHTLRVCKMEHYTVCFSLILFCCITLQQKKQLLAICSWCSREYHPLLLVKTPCFTKSCTLMHCQSVSWIPLVGSLKKDKAGATLHPSLQLPLLQICLTKDIWVNLVSYLY